ncbi:MCE family protein [Nocardioides pantholopis]|uniref:MCE family protein n=1 Tax=Nocardioides pantholopis TaxID=2483798 RepID=UPI000F08C4BA|nr:MCE family protein [Nocardioides pantholopis]
MTRYRTAFAERNKVVLALVGLTAMGLIFAAAFNAAALPVIGGGETHTARFAEAGGLRSGNEVRIAGVKVGEVEDVSLERGVVEVRFRVEDVELGDQTRAAVKVKTMLGRKYLALEPGGRGELDGPIPLENTTTPYDVNAAFSDLSETVTEIDTDQLAESFTALSEAFEDTPESVRGMVSGLTALSRTISSRDTELAALLDSTTEVTGTLQERNEEFAKIITDGSTLLAELERRRDAVGQMLDGTARLGTQLTGLVRDNEKQLAPALARLDRVTAILQRNQDHLEDALRQLGPYYRVLASATGSGRWVDTYVCGLFDAAGAPVLDNDVARDCQPAAPSSGGKP